MQLSEIRTEILDAAGFVSTDPRFTSTILNRIINRALRRLSADRDWPWNMASGTLTTAADDAEYTAPASYSKTIRMRYEARDLQLYNPADTARFANDTGTPHGYYVEEDLIHIVPVPDGVYSIEHVYYVYETALSADTDSPNLPDRYMDYLVQHALVEVATRIRDNDLYQIADRERRLWERRAVDEVRRSRTTPKMRTRYDWWI